MAVYFIDEANGADGNSGLDFDNAWQNITKITSVSAGDTVWIRRNTSTVMAGNISAINGSAGSRIRIIGCPHNSEAGTANFTQGDETVSSLSITEDFDKHICRDILCPDGNMYYIADVDEVGNTFELDRPYVGSNSTGGSFTIQKESYYDEFQNIDDSLLTIKKSNWNGDSDALAFLDNTSGNYLFTPGHYNTIANLKYHTNSSGRFRCYSDLGWYLDRCVITSNYAGLSVQTGGQGKIQNCYIQGSSYGVSFYNAYGIVEIERSYIEGGYSIGEENSGYGRVMKLNNVTLYGSLHTSGVTKIWGKDVNFLSGSVSNGGVDGYDANIVFENYGKVLGAHRNYIMGVGLVVSNDGSGADVDLRSGGSDQVCDVLINVNSGKGGLKSANDNATSEGLSALVLGDNNQMRIYNTDVTNARNYRLYVQNQGSALDSDDLWLEVEYITERNSSDEFAKTIVRSDESVAQRSGVTDWSKYIETGDITPGYEGWITFKVYCSKYDATNHIFIDPKIEIV